MYYAKCLNMDKSFKREDCEDLIMKIERICTQTNYTLKSRAIKSSLLLSCDNRHKTLVVHCHKSEATKDKAIAVSDAECAICHKRMQRWSIRQHVLRQHSRSGPVPCQICHKMFKNKNSLNKHKSVYHRMAKLQHFQSSAYPSAGSKDECSQ